MTDTDRRAEVLRDAMLAAVTGDQALVERAYTEDVTGWSPVAEVAIRRFRQYWNEAELLEGLGLLPQAT